MKKGKRWICISLLVGLLAGMCGCGAAELNPVHSIEYPYKISDELVIGGEESGEDNPEKEPVEEKEGKEEKPALSKEEEEAALAEITHLPAGVNGFAFRMYAQLGEDDDIFFSPYSLCAALSMLNLGADEETKAEIEKVLGIEDFDAWNAEMLTYLERQWTDDTFVITANAVWMDENKEFADTMDEGFLQPAADYYMSELHVGDFKGNAATVIKEINAWVKQNTKEMIPEIIKKLPEDAVMALLNAVYFEGKWENAFKEEKTYEDTFYGTEGESQVDMMHQYWEEYAYIEYADMKGVCLPYKGDEVVMKIFIPIEDGDISTLFGALSDTEKQQMLDMLDTCDKTELNRLVIPKFTMEKSIDDLPGILADMGMESAFDPNSANFDIIAEDLYVSEVLHKAKIEVDEEGTKAAAATVIVESDTTAILEPEYYEFVADRPFIYVLQDTKTGMILFLGRVNNL